MADGLNRRCGFDWCRVIPLHSLPCEDIPCTTDHSQTPPNSGESLVAREGGNFGEPLERQNQPVCAPVLYRGTSWGRHRKRQVFSCLNLPFYESYAIYDQHFMNSLANTVREKCQKWGERGMKPPSFDQRGDEPSASMTLQEKYLLKAMADLCRQLGELADAQRSLTDPAMVECSQQLDRLILKWYELRGGRTLGED